MPQLQDQSLDPLHLRYPHLVVSSANPLPNTIFFYKQRIPSSDNKSLLTNEMTHILGHDSALYGYTVLELNSANEMNFGMKHAPGAVSIAQPINLQSSAPPLCYGCPQSQNLHQGRYYTWNLSLTVAQNTKDLPVFPPRLE